MSFDVLMTARNDAIKSAYTRLWDLEKSAFKALVVLNGTATVSILAFLGSVAGKSETDLHAIVHRLRFAMILFVVGLIATGVGSVAAFYSSLFGIDPNKDPRRERFFGETAFWSLPASLGTFAVGSLSAAFVLTH